ncbi:JAB domain-containing protein [Belliella kenyensis]|uniref:JAB domain-containing protein n=1 Tax=Belliella kenyensis TaxID=1472724 RepID=UPI00338EF58B
MFKNRIWKQSLKLLRIKKIVLKCFKQGRRLPVRLIDACKPFVRSLLDHIILTAESYYSFADEGLI